jgi:hypothetical protein
MRRRQLLVEDHRINNSIPPGAEIAARSVDLSKLRI